MLTKVQNHRDVGRNDQKRSKVSPQHLSRNGRHITFRGRRRSKRATSGKLAEHSPTIIHQTPEVVPNYQCGQASDADDTPEHTLDALGIDLCTSPVCKTSSCSDLTPSSSLPSPIVRIFKQQNHNVTVSHKCTDTDHTEPSLHSNLVKKELLSIDATEDVVFCNDKEQINQENDLLHISYDNNTANSLNHQLGSEQCFPIPVVPECKQASLTNCEETFFKEAQLLVPPSMDNKIEFKTCTMLLQDKGDSNTSLLSSATGQGNERTKQEKIIVDNDEKEDNDEEEDEETKIDDDDDDDDEENHHVNVNMCEEDEDEEEEEDDDVDELLDAGAVFFDNTVSIEDAENLVCSSDEHANKDTADNYVVTPKASSKESLIETSTMSPNSAALLSTNAILSVRSRLHTSASLESVSAAVSQFVERILARNSMLSRKTLNTAIQDCYGRFIINLPHQYLSNHIQLCFAIQEAYWWYDDYWFDHFTQELPKLSMRNFGFILCEKCPLLRLYFDSHSYALFMSQWRKYCQTIPLKGAIIINNTLTKVLMVQGWRGGRWMFPRGKVDELEDDVSCAVREVREEVGVDVGKIINKNVYIETSIDEQPLKLFIIPGVLESTPFAPRKRKEISRIRWVPVVKLPGWRRCVKKQLKNISGIKMSRNSNTVWTDANSNASNPTVNGAIPLTTGCTLKGSSSECEEDSERPRFWNVHPFTEALVGWVFLLQKGTGYRDIKSTSFTETPIDLSSEWMRCSIGHADFSFPSPPKGYCSLVKEKYSKMLLEENYTEFLKTTKPTAPSGKKCNIVRQPGSMTITKPELNPNKASSITQPRVSLTSLTFCQPAAPKPPALPPFIDDTKWYRIPSNTSYKLLRRLQHPQYPSISPKSTGIITAHNTKNLANSSVPPGGSGSGIYVRKSKINENGYNNINYASSTLGNYSNSNPNKSCPISAPKPRKGLTGSIDLEEEGYEGSVMTIARQQSQHQTSQQPYTRVLQQHCRNVAGSTVLQNHPNEKICILSRPLPISTTSNTTSSSSRTKLSGGKDILVAKPKTNECHQVSATDGDSRIELITKAYKSNQEENKHRFNNNNVIHDRSGADLQRSLSTQPLSSSNSIPGYMTAVAGTLSVPTATTSKSSTTKTRSILQDFQRLGICVGPKATTPSVTIEEETIAFKNTTVEGVNLQSELHTTVSSQNCSADVVAPPYDTNILESLPGTHPKNEKHCNSDALQEDACLCTYFVDNTEKIKKPLSELNRTRKPTDFNERTSLKQSLLEQSGPCDAFSPTLNVTRSRNYTEKNMGSAVVMTDNSRSILLEVKKELLDQSEQPATFNDVRNNSRSSSNNNINDNDAGPCGTMGLHDDHKFQGVHERSFGRHQFDDNIAEEQHNEQETERSNNSRKPQNAIITNTASFDAEHKVGHMRRHSGELHSNDVPPLIDTSKIETCRRRSPTELFRRHESRIIQRLNESSRLTTPTTTKGRAGPNSDFLDAKNHTLKASQKALSRKEHISTYNRQEALLNTHQKKQDREEDVFISVNNNENILSEKPVSFEYQKYQNHSYAFSSPNMCNDTHQTLIKNALAVTATNDKTSQTHLLKRSMKQQPTDNDHMSREMAQAGCDELPSSSLSISDVCRLAFLAYKAVNTCRERVGHSRLSAHDFADVLGL